jgi:hypothetical protein
VIDWQYVTRYVLDGLRLAAFVVLVVLTLAGAYDALGWIGLGR